MTTPGAVPIIYAEWYVSEGLNFYLEADKSNVVKEIRTYVKNECNPDSYYYLNLASAGRALKCHIHIQDIL